MMAILERVRVIDSHTAGEPTRIVVEGGPDLGSGTLVERRERFLAEHDGFRAGLIEEPRGSDVLVGGLLCEPSEPGCAAGVIFFNNAGCLNMCGHGAIGLVVTLAHMGRIGPGEHRIETPVGVVTATLHPEGDVSIRNVPSYRHKKDVELSLGDGMTIRGDVAWGGNWFFLTADGGEELTLGNVNRLCALTNRIRRALERDGVTGAEGGEIDHIELTAPSTTPGVDARNFVLCPGAAYDRSPCGTGTSAKVACLAADGQLRPGTTWRQEGIVGGVFEASVEPEGARWVPTVRGPAWISAEATLLFDPDDPFRSGIRK